MCKRKVKPLNLYQLIGQKQHSIRLIYKFPHRNKPIMISSLRIHRSDPRIHLFLSCLSDPQNISLKDTLKYRPTNKISECVIYLRSNNLNIVNSTLNFFFSKNAVVTFLTILSVCLCE